MLLKRIDNEVVNEGPVIELEQALFKIHVEQRLLLRLFSEGRLTIITHYKLEASVFQGGDYGNKFMLTILIDRYAGDVMHLQQPAHEKHAIIGRLIVLWKVNKGVVQVLLSQLFSGSQEVLSVVSLGQLIEQVNILLPPLKNVLEGI